jgi:FkbM family methyltransferase
MTNEKLKKLFNAALVGYAQDNQENLVNKKNLILNSVKHPGRMTKLTGLVVKNKLLHKSSLEKITTFWGDTMNVVIPEEVSLKLFAYGYFEGGLTGIILENLNKNDTFMDVGAHFGYFTLLGSTIVGDQGRVHSFEPSPPTYRILESNTLRKSNITINNAALFSKNGRMRMRIHEIERSAYNSIIPEGSGNSEEITYVNTMCLDDYVKSNKIRPDFIKLDAEDAEYEILSGGKITLETFKPIISLEVGGVNSKKCIGYLEDIGYAAYTCRKGKVSILDNRAKYEYDNLVFFSR